MTLESQDHDLLIELKTLVKVVIENQATTLDLVHGVSARVSKLENEDSKDSERIGNILEMVKATANNATRIAEAHTRVDNFKVELDNLETSLKGRMDAMNDELKSLRNKNNIMDAINAAGAVVAGVVGSIFGGR